MALYPRQTASGLSPAIASHEGSLSTLTECCAAGIRSAGEYAIELDAGDAQPFSAEPARLSLGLSGPVASEQCRSVQASMEAARKKYHDRSGERLAQWRAQMRESWAAAQKAVGEFTESLSAENTAHGPGIRE